MAKSSGLGQGIIVAGFSIPGDVSTVAVRGGPSLLEVTGLDKSAHERIGGLLDGGMDLATFFNDATGRAHLTLRGLPTTDVIVIYYHASSIGAVAANIVGKELDYAPTRGADGPLMFSVPSPANGFSVEMGGAGEDGLLTAGLRTDSIGTNGTALDGGATSITGWSAYLAVTALTGTNIVVTLEDSADNVSFATFASSAFASVTAPNTSERIAGAAGATVRRYVRAVSSGTFTSATFIVAFCRHPVGATA